MQDMKSMLEDSAMQVLSIYYPIETSVITNALRSVVLTKNRRI
jgi:hypothetical protein